MQIRDMTPGEVTALLNRVPLGRLACARDGQPHIAPLSFAHEGGSLFAFSTRGQKIDWMRENPLVCVEFEEVQSPRSWNVVLVNGVYQELDDADPLAAHAFSLLKSRPMWWEPGSVRAPGEGGGRPVHFRIAIRSATGRSASGG